MPAWYADSEGDGYGDAEGYAPVAEAAAALELDHESLSLPAGTGARVVATLTFNSGRNEDVSGLVEWSSDAPTIIRVGSGTEAGGLVDALVLGKAARGMSVCEGVFRNAYTVRGLREGLLAVTATLGAATVAGPTLIISAPIILAIHSVHVVQREMLPERLAESVHRRRPRLRRTSTRWSHSPTD